MAIVFASAAAYLQKLAGLSVPRRVLEHRITIKIAALIPVALLGALISVQTLAQGQDIVFDARIPAAFVAMGLIVLRAPFLVVVFGAAAVAALIRMM